MRIWLENSLLRAWQKRGLLAYLLRPLSLLFQWIVAFRFGLFVMGYKAQTRLPVPVIVVGNIYIGGTGKTPLVIWLVQQLQKAGWHPGVVSRGYGAAADNVSLLDAHADAAVAGDEPVLIAQRTSVPVAVGRGRVAAARALLQAFPDTDVLIADDGLQHYFLARDIEIMLFDQRGAGNGWMLPAGPLREPLTRRRDFTVVNAPEQIALTQIPGVPAAAVRMQLIAQDAYQLMQPQRRQALSEMKNARVIAAAGIGNPQRFFMMLKAAGLQYEEMPLADHQHFHSGIFAGRNADCILITEKDAVKCRQIPALQTDARIWVVPVEAQLDPGFAADLLPMIAEKKHGRTSA